MDTAVAGDFKVLASMYFTYWGVYNKSFGGFSFRYGEGKSGLT